MAKDVEVKEISQTWLDGFSQTISKAVADTARETAKEMRGDSGIPVDTGEYRDSLNAKVNRKKAEAYVFEDRKKKRTPKTKLIGHHVEKHKSHWGEYDKKVQKKAPLKIADAINKYTGGR